MLTGTTSPFRSLSHSDNFGHWKKYVTHTHLEPASRDTSHSDMVVMAMGAPEPIHLPHFCLSQLQWAEGSSPSNKAGLQACALHPKSSCMLQLTPFLLQSKLVFLLYLYCDSLNGFIYVWVCMKCIHPEEVPHASRNADSVYFAIMAIQKRARWVSISWHKSKKGYTESAFRDACRTSSGIHRTAG
jgi:hypothetical protein